MREQQPRRYRAVEVKICNRRQALDLDILCHAAYGEFARIRHLCRCFTEAAMVAYLDGPEFLSFERDKKRLEATVLGQAG